MTLQLTFKPPQGYVLNNFNLFLEFDAKLIVSTYTFIVRVLISHEYTHFLSLLLLKHVSFIFGWYVSLSSHAFSVSATYKSRRHYCISKCKCHRISVAVKYSSNLTWHLFNGQDSIVHSFCDKLNRIFIIRSYQRIAPILETMKWQPYVRNYAIIRLIWQWANRQSHIGIEYPPTISYWILICTLMKWKADTTPHFGNDSDKSGFIICRYFWCALISWKNSKRICFRDKWLELGR